MIKYFYGDNMTKRKKIKVKKKIKILFTLILLIIISISSIKIYQTFSNKNTQITIPTNTTTKNTDKISTSLKELNYNEEEITTLKKYVSEETLNFIINNKLNNNTIISLVNENYYIDEYLEKYLNYYENNQDLDFKEIITRVNTHIDNEFYTNSIETNTSLGKFVILNKFYKADNTYKGQNLITVDKKYNLYNTDFQLSEECFEAFLKMYNDAEEAGYAFKINSAYRSYEKQVNIYNGWVNQDGTEKADTYSARPGYSEHQTGYAFDVRDYPKTNDDYGKTKSFTWVSQNAHKYGFILRFPKGKEYITGYQYESWHYRYCGIECATYIYEHDITFEEYYEYFIKFNNPKNLT